MQTKPVYLCIGGNLGNRPENLEETRMFIGFNMGDIVKASSVYETEPWEMTNVPTFLNQVLEINTRLSPEELMLEILELEEFFGRKRSGGEVLSREMDVDILMFGDLVVQTEKITIPHPRMQLRKFVMVPLCEIAPDMVHPVLKKTMKELLDKCEDKSEVRLFP